MVNKKNELDNLNFERERVTEKSIKKKKIHNKITDEKINRYLKVVSAVAITLLVLYLLSIVVGEHTRNLLSTLGMIASAFIIAYLLSILLEPAKHLLEKIKIKNDSAKASIITLLFLALIVLIIFVVIVPAIKSLAQSATNIDIVESAKNTYNRFMGIIPEWMSQYLVTYTTDIGEYVSKIDPELILPFIVKAFGGIFKIIIIMVYTFIFLFFMLKEKVKLMASFENAMPQRFKRHYKNFTMTSDKVFKQYIKGYFTVIFSLFIISLVTFLIIALVTKNNELLKYAFLFALILAVTDLIPYIGPWIGGALILIISAIIIGSFPIVVAIIIAIIIFQVLENVALQPIIMGNSVAVHPLGIFSAIIIFASLGIGIIGIILAAPIASIMKILSKYIRDEMAEKRKMEASIMYSESGIDLE